ncbi:hypothetical protein MUN76_06265 [Leucobacter rhizosphaerae]|uniref:Uncharacterized protein n=1 Tax=Leucobacter rhizosphaerae TaxID=2932245 RepID=A0ABY4FZ25_9MICO|nr:hypothetical protein [Leucobacter rhizosphaerae]UOQ61560.1 hypothetical protein MUN76_06265 [Leucobacter rhizosphaerae]
MSDIEDPTPERPSAPAVGDGLLERVEVIEAQPLDQRAAQFEQVHDELLAELQRGDHGAA